MPLVRATLGTGAGLKGFISLAPSYRVFRYVEIIDFLTGLFIPLNVSSDDDRSRSGVGVCIKIREASDLRDTEVWESVSGRVAVLPSGMSRVTRRGLG